jgi:hypothetical protein
LNFFLPARFFGVLAANCISSLGTDIQWEPSEFDKDMSEEDEELFVWNISM